MNTSIKMNPIAEFEDKKLEEQYFGEYLDDNYSYLKMLAAFFGLLFFLMGFLDLLFSSNTQTEALVIRVTALAASALTYRLLSKHKQFPASVMSVIVTVHEAVLVLCYLGLLYVQKNENYMDYTVSLMLMILVLYLVPNRWIHCLLVSAMGIIGFFIVTTVYMEGLTLDTARRSMTFMMATLALAAVTAYRGEYRRRAQYVRERQLTLMAETDSLTQTFNRQKFEQAFSEWHNLANNSKTTFSVIMFNINDFKQLNEEYGHAVGDQVIVDCIKAISKNIREQDMLVRWGGVEFLVLLPMTSLTKANDLSDLLQQQIDELRFGDGVGITANFSAVEYWKDESQEELISRLEQRLYKEHAVQS